VAIETPEVELPIFAFSGSRGFTERRVVVKVLRGLLQRYGPRMRVRVGDADGLDRIVREEASRMGIMPWVEICWWPPKGATKREKWLAAHDRNLRVVVGSARNPGWPQELWAFFAPGPRSPGTSDAVQIALDEHVVVKTYHSGQWTEQ
jgi:hypothetical protein